MSVNIYRIDCLTNMHVGSGDANYNIVDNEVERDPILGTPTINSSGIKGALRSHFESKWGKDNPKVTDIFGSEHGTTEDSKKTSVPGSYKFLNANIIARPLRVSDGTVSYVNVTTVEIINNTIKLLINMGITKLYEIELKEIECDISKGHAVMFDVAANISKIENLIVDKRDNISIKNLLDKLIGGNYAIATTQDLNGFDLPVMARNQLEDGTSKNLWYEEVVPHKSVFYFTVLSPDKDKSLEFTNNELVQFGGNASIGYGYTNVSKVV